VPRCGGMGPGAGRRSGEPVPAPRGRQREAEDVGGLAEGVPGVYEAGDFGALLHLDHTVEPEVGEGAAAWGHSGFTFRV